MTALAVILQDRRHIFIEGRRRRIFFLLRALMTCSITRMPVPASRIFLTIVDDLVDLRRVQAGHDLVEQQQLRLHRQRLGQFEPLAVGAAERVGALIERDAEAGKIEQRPRLLARPPVWLARRRRSRTARRR